MLEGLNDEEVHVIRGPFVIKQSRVKGRIVNRLKSGFLLITGPGGVGAHGFRRIRRPPCTVFRRSMDRIRPSIRRVIVQDRFTGAMFSDTHFGPHARFHRSVFAGPAIFRGATFQGLTEFLEVVFEQDANFSRAVFHPEQDFPVRIAVRSATSLRLSSIGKHFFCSPSSTVRLRLPPRDSDRRPTFPMPHLNRPMISQATFARTPQLTRTARVSTTMPGPTAWPGSIFPGRHDLPICHGAGAVGLYHQGQVALVEPTTYSFSLPAPINWYKIETLAKGALVPDGPT